MRLLTALQVEPLCKLEDDRPVCSVAWTQRGNYLAIGTTKGVVRIYDAAAVRKQKSCSRLLVVVVGVRGF